MRGARILAAMAVGGLAAVVGSPTAASAVSPQQIRCGDTITTNVTLTRNLVCPGDGLTVGAPGLTIDLDGHALIGSGGGVGISGAVDLTVVDGTIRGFDIGVRGQVDATSVTFRSNRQGMRLDYGDSSVTNSVFDSNGAGIVHGFATLTVTSTVFRKNGTAMSCGDAEIVVTRSKFVDNQTGIYGSVCGARIHANQFSGGDVAVRLHSQGYVLDVRDNTFIKAGVGLRLTGIGDATHAVVDNVFKDNRASGLVVIPSNPTWGYPVQVAGNTFAGNGFDPGAEVDPTGIPLTSGVWAGAGTFTGNRANANAGHGIEGYGVVDGGGNTARSNGAQPQCVGVVCSPR